MFRRSHPASKLSNTELKKLEHLYLMVDNCTLDMQRGQDTASRLADAINGYPNATMVYEVMRRIRKCFKSGNAQVVLRALDLTDVLMQSCGSHARREVASDKFLKQIGKLCRVTKTRLDPSWVTVSERAQELVAGWAEASQRMVGSGNKFTQMYENLRRDGVPFRGGSGDSASARGGYAAAAGAGGRFRSAGGSVLRPGDEGYDEEADLAAAIFASSISATGGAGGAGAAGARGGGAGGLPAASGDGSELLSMVPPTIEALMDIMEGSKDLTELLDNDVVEDVVDQTRGLVEQVIKKVEELNVAGNPDEKDMDRYLKAHDDLQTVLRVYDAVMDGNEPLPLSRGAAGTAVRGTGEATAAAEAAFAAAAAAASNGNAGGGAYSSDDESVENGVGGKGARAKGAGASGGKNSPPKGNLLDLEENAPLETGMTGEGAGGMLVAYAGGGQFMASNTNSVGGVSGVSGVGGLGFDSSSSGPQGSATASASDTGAVYGSNQFGSNQFGSNQFGSNNFGSSNFSSGGGMGDGSSGFAPADPFASFGGGAPSSAAPNAPGAPSEPAPRPRSGSFPPVGLPDNQASSIVSVTTSNPANRGAAGARQQQGQQQGPSTTDFGSWMSTRGGYGGAGDPFAPSPPSSSGYSNGLLGGPGRHKLFSVRESPSFASSNGGGGTDGGSVVNPSPSLSSAAGGGSNPFEMTSPRTAAPAHPMMQGGGGGGGGARAGAGAGGGAGFSSPQDLGAGGGVGVAGAAPGAIDPADPFSLVANGVGGGGIGAGALVPSQQQPQPPPQQQQQQQRMLPLSTSFASGSTNRNRSFSEYSATSSQGPPPPPQQQQQQQQPQQQPQEQGGNWWQPQQGPPQQQHQQQQHQQQVIDPFAPAVGPAAAAAASDPFAAQAPTGPAPTVSGHSRGSVGSGSFDSGRGRTSTGGASGDFGAAFGQALVVAGAGGGAAAGGGPAASGERKYNPFDEPSAAVYAGAQQQAVPQQAQQQQQWQPYPQQQQMVAQQQQQQQQQQQPILPQQQQQQFPQAPFQQAPQLQGYGGEPQQQFQPQQEFQPQQQQQQQQQPPPQGDGAGRHYV
eukprot:g12167.t1